MSIVEEDSPVARFSGWAIIPDFIEEYSLISDVMNFSHFAMK